MIRLIILILLMPAVAMAQNQTYYYSSKVVELEGIIKELTFPGQPNYTSIKDGDATETGAYILLDKPIDIVKKPKEGAIDYESEKNVTLIQIVVYQKAHWKRIKNGNKVKIKGTFFHALTGHHHTRVLIELQTIDVVKSHVKKDLYTQLSIEDKDFLELQNRETNGDID